jgi:uncharacterized protein (TIGR02271 family)
MKNDDPLQKTLHQQGQDRANSPIEQNVEYESITPVIEEQFRVDKKTVETGLIRLSKQVTEHEETFTVPLIHEEIEVERVPINQLIESQPLAIRYEGETMIIPIIKEVAVIEKRLMLVEELRLIKRQHREQTTQSVNLRKEAVSVERINIDRSD